jgi:uncharacterized protein YoxC
MTALEQLPGRLDGVESRLVELSTRVDGLSTRVDGLSTRVDGLSIRVDGLSTRFDGLSTRVDGLSDRVDVLSTRVDELSTRIDDGRRETRVLREDALGRIAVIGEGLTTLSERVDFQFTALTGMIDASRTEARTMFSQILARLDAPRRKKRG